MKRRELPEEKPCQAEYNSFYSQAPPQWVQRGKKG